MFRISFIVHRWRLKTSTQLVDPRSRFKGWIVGGTLFKVMDQVSYTHNQNLWKLFSTCNLHTVSVLTCAERIVSAWISLFSWIQETRSEPCPVQTRFRSIFRPHSSLTGDPETRSGTCPIRLGSNITRPKQDPE